jgi:signal transduction histidine kinase
MSPANDEAKYRLYREEVSGERMVAALRSGIVVVIALTTGFIGLDFAAYRESFASLLASRLALDVALLIAWVCAPRMPQRAMVGAVLATGLGLVCVIGIAGGVASAYFPGLMLLLLGMPVLLPVSGRQSFFISLVLFSAYASLPLFTGASVPLREYLLPIFFPGAAAFECVASCVLLDRLRFQDFCRRQELVEARDELRALDVAKSRFTANIHHELRTPLTLTLAPVEAMLGGEFGELTELQTSYLQTIRSNGLRLLKLINNLLDLAKIESQQLEVTRRPLRIGELVDELVASAVPLAERKGVVLAAEVAPGVPEIHADRDALEKVIVNLMGNALKFTESGGRIDVRVQADADGGIDLRVEDSGIGIPPDQVDRIFDRFAQVDGSTTRRHEGTGIGLSLVKELVELHGGRVWAESDGVGQGTRIHVVLPVGESDIEGEGAVEEAVLAPVHTQGANAIAAMQAELDLEDEADPERRQDLRVAEIQRNVERAEGQRTSEHEASAAAAHVAPDAPEVLIVEDNPDMRRLLRFLVGREYRVRVAKNGREGLEQVRETPPDLVLTDVMMPEMSGTELCAAIKQDPQLAGIPVVLVTSKAEREMKIEGLELGADDYVTKPFHPRELLARVRSLVKLREAQHELGVRNALLENANEELRRTMQELREAGAQLVQTERLAAVGELAAGIAHEVNNPVNFALNAVKTMRTLVAEIGEVVGQVASMGGGDPEDLAGQLRELAALRDRIGFEQAAEDLSELGDIVTEGLERTSRLVGDLRDFAAPGDRGTTEVDLDRGLRSTLQLMGFSLKEQGITTCLELAPSLPPVEGDARALNQVFLNLLKNAAEACEGGRGTISVRSAREGNAVVVEIRDDGPGMGPELQTRVFEPFFTTKEAGQGSGLGLSITRRIVSEHGGELSLESAPGAGSCFRVRLPLAGASLEKDTLPREGDAPGGAPLAS